MAALQVIDRGTEAILTFLRRVWVANQTQVLDLSDQGIESVHASICSLTNVTRLTLDDNLCTTIPPEIVQLQKLEVLSMQQNRLMYLPGTIGHLQSVRELLIGKNPTLKALPPEMSLMPKLELLGYEDNALESPGMEICAKGVVAVQSYLAALLHAETSKKILLSSAGLNQFAMDLAAKSTVMFVDVSNNYLDTMHKGFFTFLNVTHLDVSYNRLRQIPSLIGNLRELVTFIADGNVLESLPTTMAYIEKLETISAADNNVIEIPHEYGNLSSLQTLNLAGNLITVLISELHKVTTLTSIGLARNHITNLPHEWGLLTNVTELDLADNKMEDPPLEVRRKGVSNTFQYLRKIMHSFVHNILDLRGLNLESVDAVLVRNYNLLEAHLDDNRIKSLPEEVGTHVHVDLPAQVFDALFVAKQNTDAPFNSLQISVLKRMRLLSITNNHITSLPAGLGVCTNLEVLRLDINKMKSPPKDIVKEEVTIILHYLRNFAAAQRVPAALLAKFVFLKLKHRFSWGVTGDRHSGPPWVATPGSDA
eukprot:2955573-Rhodomonas_salina.1